MVRVYYENIEASYEYIKQIATGKASTVLILTANELDGIASTRMLAQLLKNDNIYFSIQMVDSIQKLQLVYARYSSTNEERIVIMMNCGATLNIPKLLDLERGGSTRCFVMDNHRPLHLANIYSAFAVTVFCDIGVPGDDEDVPDDGSELSVNDFDDDELEGEEEEELEDGESDEEYGEDRVGEGVDGMVEAEDEAEGDAEFEEDVSEVDDDEENDEKNDEEEDEVDEEEEEEEELGMGGEGDIGGEQPENDDAVELDDAIGEGESSPGPDVVREEASEVAASPMARESEEDTRSLSASPTALSKRTREQLDEHGNPEDEEVVHGRRRVHIDPKLARKESIRQYYQSPAMYACNPTAFSLLPAVQRQINATTLNTDLLWQAVIGVTDQLIRRNLVEADYNRIAHAVKGDLSSLAKISTGYTQTDKENNGASVHVPNSEAGSVKYKEEYRFFMTRHWSLLESMRYSNYLAVKMSTYKSQSNRLYEFVARIGLPLDQLNQHYQHMLPSLKQHFANELRFNTDLLSEYNLENPSVFVPSFIRYISFKSEVSVSDVVYAATALLESNNENSLLAFNDCYGCLGSTTMSEKLFAKGLKIALNIQKSIVNKASLMLERNDIKSLRTFRYARINRIGSNSKRSNMDDRDFTAADDLFERPLVLARLASFLTDIKISSGSWKGKSLLPLFIISEKVDSFIILVHYPRANELADATGYVPYPRFRTLFSMLAKEYKMEQQLSLESFDVNIAEVSKDHLESLLGNVDHHLKRVLKVNKA